MDKKIILLGLNHRTAPVEVREQYALTNVEGFEEGLLRDCPVSECLALSTCNRVEILAVTDTDEDASGAVLSYWARVCGGDVGVLSSHVYAHEGLAAVEHVFRVAASLDSMIMGEPQILGQLKASYRKAVTKGAARVIVNRLLHKSFSVAKRVRTETAIASSAVSISFAAVELARKIFGDLAGKTAMLIGAGEMAELAATHLLTNGISRLLIANRTLARAKELAKTMRGEAVAFEDLFARLPEADIVISSTGSPTAIIHSRDMKAVLKARKHAAMFFIDIAVPRDIDPDVNSLDNVYLYDIDDLKEVVEGNLAQRREEAVKAQDIVVAETETFGRWLKSLDLQPTIVDLMGRAEDIGRRELARTLRRIGPVDEETRKALETLVLSVGHKLLHEPVVYLKRRAQEETAERFIDQARRMFNLDREDVPQDAHSDRKRPDADPEDEDGGEPVCHPQH